MANSKTKRYLAPRISLFNHKGGVGKTSLTFNIASALGSLGKKVLLVDTDPQSNLTSFFVEDSVVDDLLDKSDTQSGNTIWTALKPIIEATGDVKIIKPLEMRNNIYLIPGDIKLAEFEEELPGLWNDCYQSKLKGYRGISSISKLVNIIAEEKEIDYIFYDSGPNIGVLNKIILLDCDYYIIPAACDIFSMRAIKTLGHTLFEWIKNWKILYSLAPSSIYILPGAPIFLGYIPQRFKTYAGILTSKYSELVPKLERQIRGEIINQLNALDSDLIFKGDFKLRIGEIKDYGQSATSSQVEGKAIWELNNLDAETKKMINKDFLNIALSIIDRIKLNKPKLS